MAVTALSHHDVAQGHRDVMLLNYIEVLHSLWPPVPECHNIDIKVPIWRSALLSACLLALGRRHCVSAVCVHPDDSFAALLALVMIHTL